MQFKHVEDKFFMQNLDNFSESILFQQNVNYLDVGFSNFIYNVAKYLNAWNSKSMSHRVKKDTIVPLTPYEILEGKSELHYIPEKIIAEIFKLIPEYKTMFTENAAYKILFEPLKNQRIGFDTKYVFDYSQIIDNNEALISELKSKNLILFDKLAIDLFSYITTTEFNQGGHNYLINSFNSIFEDEEKIDFNEHWFYKSPRTCDVSHSGHLDMAIHAWINNSNVLSSLIEFQKTMVFKNI